MYGIAGSFRLLSAEWIFSAARAGARELFHPQPDASSPRRSSSSQRGREFGGIHHLGQLCGPHLSCLGYRKSTHNVRSPSRSHEDPLSELFSVLEEEEARGEDIKAVHGQLQQMEAILADEDGSGRLLEGMADDGVGGMTVREVAEGVRELLPFVTVHDVRKHLVSRIEREGEAGEGGHDDCVSTGGLRQHMEGFLQAKRDELQVVEAGLIGRRVACERRAEEMRQRLRRRYCTVMSRRLDVTPSEQLLLKKDGVRKILNTSPRPLVDALFHHCILTQDHEQAAADTNNGSSNEIPSPAPFPSPRTIHWQEIEALFDLPSLRMIRESYLSPPFLFDLSSDESSPSRRRSRQTRKTIGGALDGGRSPPLLPPMFLTPTVPTPTIQRPRSNDFVDNNEHQHDHGDDEQSDVPPVNVGSPSRTVRSVQSSSPTRGHRCVALAVNRPLHYVDSGVSVPVVPYPPFCMGEGENGDRFAEGGGGGALRA
ncbi:unnamed protein product [Vitrella brassicaformis CCMP3155]|uniref:Uncharacterized protein n=3 Tax=Vitrella brassicaformis TaxID=1169539 RepID=A0A0G4FHD5_VITBC|nr:unnamed protein product [Vitrella brassicaformis CCMP3155]|eukprot:CEM12837.1 unnamed protein product [Vitrella brassicaformis CCMP3155]